MPANLLKKIWHMLPLKIRQNIGQKLNIITLPIKINYIKSILKRPNPIDDGVTLIGLFNGNLGHSTAARLLALDLEKSGIIFNCLDTTSLLNHSKEINDFCNFDNNNSYYGKTLIIIANPDSAIHILWNIKNENLIGRKLIFYWVWELETLPKYWNYFKGVASEIWTPSNFSADTIAKVFDVPINIVPLAVALSDNKLPLNAPEIKKNIGIEKNSFVALQSFSFSSSIERKNVLGAIEAFKIAFGKSMSHTLILRYTNSINYNDALNRLKFAIQESGINCHLIEGQSLQDMYDFYAIADVYISLHRSEGFGLNIAEALINKIPCITTNWSGNLTFTPNDYPFLIEQTPIAIYDIDKIYVNNKAKWAQPNITQAASIIKEISLHVEKYEAKIIEAQDYAIKKLSGFNFKRPYL